ncbi:MFS transporter [Microbacterium paludicola]|uniref:MFS transporter n=1 Tax=Microbacterium paludicola TaxID=300019 RepID=A0A4Y9FY19_9MICO|nr:MFS transporter [Microbacterium paludicola]MBF0816215.1 MHS family MFS transporter [Microbacterium paludicola]TFU33152.1 MFS transporter [Microbacterium paludicola]
MSSRDAAPGTLTPTGTIASPVDRRRVVVATVVGTTVEWYDFFTYAFAASSVFAVLFFQPAGESLAPIWSTITIGVSFLFRPLGAFLAGHFGDKIGRRPMLVATLILMGGATMLVGMLPTYAAIGVAAPIMLVFLRILQGLSAGGEWGGAVLMAVEHAPKNRRGLYGAMPQIGVPIGLLLASAVVGVMRLITPDQESFLAWGWRVPFLLSFVLIFVGYWVRRRVEESPVFEEIAERREQAKIPVVRLFARYAPLVLLAAFVFVGNNAVGYMTTGGFIQNYASNPDGPLALNPAAVQWAIVASAVAWLVTTLAAGILSDRFGRRTVYIGGWIVLALTVVALFPLVNTGTIGGLTAGVVLLGLGLGLTYGAQSSWYSELFPASVRFSGVSIAYAIGSIFGGAFAPTIATAILGSTGSTTGITWYLLGTVAVSMLGTLLLRDRKGIDLSPANEANQEKRIYIWK